MNGRESGFFFLPVVLFICIGMGSVFALLPSFQHEEFLEAQRLRNEQARASARQYVLALADSGRHCRESCHAVFDQRQREAFGRAKARESH